MHKVLVQVSSMIMIMTGPQASYDVGNKDNHQTTQPMTASDCKVWNRDAPLSHKKYPQDIIRHRVGMTAAGSIETIKVEVHVFFATVKL